MELAAIRIESPDDLNVIIGAGAYHQDTRGSARGARGIKSAPTFRDRVLRGVRAALGEAELEVNMAGDPQHSRLVAITLAEARRG